MSCPLCRKEEWTEWKYYDQLVWVARCATHREKWLIVLNRHTAQPEEYELKHMREVAEMLFPGKKWRYPRSILDHFHLHEV